MVKTLKQYGWNVLIAIDQLGNAMLAGDPDETISSRVGKIMRRNPNEKSIAHTLGQLLDKIDPGHCREAIEEDEGKNAVDATPVNRNFMRAKVKVATVRDHDHAQIVTMHPVGKSQYDQDGEDEDNTYAKYTPAGLVELHIANPTLRGQLAQGDRFYVDFTRVGKQ